MFRACAFAISSGLLLIKIVAAQAADPASGFVYNTQEASSLYYECARLTDGNIACEFLQTSVRKKAKPEDLSPLLSKKRTEFRSGQGRLEKKDCDYLQSLEAAVRSGTPTAGMNAEEFRRGFQAMPAKQKDEILQSLKPLSDYCKSPTEENYLSIASAEHNKNARTCLVNSHKFNQIFKMINKDTWSVIDSPTGPCGIVNVSRLQRGEGDASIFWIYYSKKVVTNPNGEFTFGGSCSKLDQAEYKYDWRSNEHNMGCDYISLSIF